MRGVQLLLLFLACDGVLSGVSEAHSVGNLSWQISDVEPQSYQVSEVEKRLGTSSLISLGALAGLEKPSSSDSVTLLLSVAVALGVGLIILVSGGKILSKMGHKYTPKNPHEGSALDSRTHGKFGPDIPQMPQENDGELPNDKPSEPFTLDCDTSSTAHRRLAPSVLRPARIDSTATSLPPTITASVDQDGPALEPTSVVDSGDESGTLAATANNEPEIADKHNNILAVDSDPDTKPVIQTQGEETAESGIPATTSSNEPDVRESESDRDLSDVDKESPVLPTKVESERTDTMSKKLVDNPRKPAEPASVAAAVKQAEELEAEEDHDETADEPPAIQTPLTQAPTPATPATPATQLPFATRVVERSHVTEIRRDSSEGEVWDPSVDFDIDH